MAPTSLNPSLENLALTLGVPVDSLKTGLPEALNAWEAFVSRMPDRLATPAAFKKVLANNYELVYNMLEAAALKLGADNVRLLDELRDAEAAYHEQQQAQLDMIRKLSLVMPASAWCMDGESLGDDSLGFVDESEDGLPLWKISVELPNHEHVTAVMSHAKMAKFFPHVVVTNTDPDPDYVGIGAYDADFAADGHAGLGNDDTPL